MSPEQWLEKVGSEYLARVRAEEPQFLVEVDVPDDRLEEIFNNISRARPIRWTTEQRLCLALAAVHSAARADKGEDTSCLKKLENLPVFPIQATQHQSSLTCAHNLPGQEQATVERRVNGLNQAQIED